MGHNSVVLGHPKFTGISRVEGLSTGPLDLGRHKSCRDTPVFYRDLKSLDLTKLLS